MESGSWNRPQRVGLMLLIVCSLVAAAVAFYGTRDAGPSPAPVVQPAPAGPVASITLPVFDPDVPPGPHRATFQTSCTICHSTQLVFNQPRFSSKKWDESIKKMVATYGAPILPAQQAEILTYLTAVHGSQ